MHSVTLVLFKQSLLMIVKQYIPYLHILITYNEVINDTANGFRYNTLQFNTIFCAARQAWGRSQSPTFTPLVGI